MKITQNSKKRLLEILKSQPSSNVTYTYEEFADYLIQNGVIAPPLHICDTVYLIMPERYGNHVIEALVTQIGTNGIEMWFDTRFKINDQNERPYRLYESCLGTIGFFTYKEAEKALEGNKDNS